MSANSWQIAILGSGPAALMAASVLAEAGVTVTIHEKSNGPGRKLLIAGGSGLNISNSLPLAAFASHYKGSDIGWMDLLEKFSVADWLSFIHKLGHETFEGTSGRYFVREMKASGLLRAWIDDLKNKNVTFHFGQECTALTQDGKFWHLTFANGSQISCGAVLCALGGGSWLKEAARWPQIFTSHGITINPFASANCGFKVRWTENFLAEAAGQPLKNVELISSAGRRKGDVMITRYGVEGTPIYSHGRSEICFVDLKPDFSEMEILQKLNSMQENLTPLRRAKRVLNLSDTTLALLYHESPRGALESNPGLARLIKKFPLELGERQPLNEAISSTGGIALREIDSDFMLRKLPGVYACGEMLDWDAPTGGFLIQACVSQGYVAANAMLKDLDARH